MKIDKSKIKKILVVRNDRFGEFLLNIPALRALKETFPEALVISVVDPYVSELASAISFIDQVIEWGGKKHTFLEKLRMIRALKGKNIDAAVILNPSKEFNLFTCLAGIPVRVGYDRKWGGILTDKIKDQKYLGEKHEVEYNLELVGLLGAETHDKSLSLKTEDSLADSLFNEFGIKEFSNLVALHPWTSDPVKQWPKENFRGLAERLAKDLGKKVVIIGGKSELKESIRLFRGLERIVNFTAKTSLKQLAAVLKRCKLLISGDSGPVHLAAAAGTQVIALFRNDIPAKGAKRWGPWGEGHIVIEKNNLYEIGVDEVFVRAKEALGS